MAVDRTELARQITATAQRLGIHPSDLATAISYESAGTFSPTIKGPTTQWGQHIGLIQAGEPQRQKYGIDPQAPLAEQFAGIERYLRDAGVREGHSLLDIYSAINAGKVGRYNASDAAAGGAPGTVADKVATQMLAHRIKANQLLGLPIPGNPVPVTAAAPGYPASPAQGVAAPPASTDAAINQTATPSMSNAAGEMPSMADLSDSEFQQLLSLVRQRLQPEPIQMMPFDMPDLRRRRVRTASMRR